MKSFGMIYQFYTKKLLNLYKSIRKNQRLIYLKNYTRKYGKTFKVELNNDSQDVNENLREERVRKVMDELKNSLKIPAVQWVSAHD